MKNKNNSWNSFTFLGLTQVVASLTVVFSVFSLFSQYHRYFELLSHFKIQYLFASVSCAIILAVYKNIIFPIVLLFVVALNSLFIVPWYFSNSDNVSNDNHTDLKILQSNVHTANKNFEGFVKLINEEKPDIFIMQEVNKKWLIGIGELEKIYTHKMTLPQEDNFGIALFSKYSFESVKEVIWGDAYLPSIVATLSISGQNVTIITTHPLPPVGDEYFHSRNSQLIRVAQEIRKIEGPLILIGDLNTTMWSHDYQPLEQGTGLRNARKGFGMLPTWPTQFLLSIFMIPLDHVLVSSHFTVKDIKVGKNIGSDHMPLIVKLGLKI